MKIVITGGAGMIGSNLTARLLEKGHDITSLKNFTNDISKRYNIGEKNIIKDFLNYIIRNKETLNIPKYFNFVENIIHFEDCKNS